MRYLFIGSVQYSAKCLKTLLSMKVNIVGIMGPNESACKLNNDYADIGIVAGKFRKTVYYFDHIKEERNYIRQCMPDIIFVLGLSQIIPKEILDIPAIGCIGSHPALLPQNRGRHPIIWTLANGLTKAGVTLFWLDEGVDSGDIWAQEEFKVSHKDDAATLYKKVTNLSIQILKRKIPELEDGNYSRFPQANSKSNYWRKRNYKDGEIDWRMSSERIYNLVRSLAKPYVGAHCNLNGNEIKVWKCKILKMRKNLERLEPGKVIKKEEKKITVKTGDGLLQIMEHEFWDLPEPGNYLL